MSEPPTIDGMLHPSFIGVSMVVTQVDCHVDFTCIEARMPQCWLIDNEVGWSYPPVPVHFFSIELMQSGNLQGQKSTFIAE